VARSKSNRINNTSDERSRKNKEKTERTAKARLKKNAKDKRALEIKKNQANLDLKQAKDLEKQGKTQLAVARYKKIVKKYRGTKAATEALDLLERINAKQQIRKNLVAGGNLSKPKISTTASQKKKQPAASGKPKPQATQKTKRLEKGTASKKQKPSPSLQSAKKHENSKGQAATKFQSTDRVRNQPPVLKGSTKKRQASRTELPANKQLQQARMLLKKGDDKKARRILAELVKKFPKSQASKEAKRLLKK